MADGDLPTALVWFTKALKLEADQPDRAEIHRLRIASALRDSPTIAMLWSFPAPVHYAVYSPDGRRVAAISGHSVKVWDAESGTAITPELGQIPSNDESGALRPVDLQFSPDGARLLVGSGSWWASFGGEASLWDLGKTELTSRKFEAGDSITKVGFSSDGKLFFAATGSTEFSQQREHRVLIFDADAKVLPRPIRQLTEGSQAILSPSGDCVAMTHSRFPAKASIWDSQTGKLRYPSLIVGNGEANFVAFSPDGRRFLTASSSRNPSGGILRVWNTESGQALTPAIHHRRRVRSATFSPDGRYVATATGDDLDEAGEYEAWVLDAALGHPIMPPVRHAGAIRVVQFGPDSDVLLTASDDRTVRVWNIETGEALTPPLHSRHPVTSASFRGDGHQILVSSGDRYLGSGEVRLWDWETARKPIPAIQGPQFSSVGYQYSPDGRRAVSFPAECQWASSSPACCASAPATRWAVKGRRSRLEPASPPSSGGGWVCRRAACETSCQ
jgi:WD40 repeat protein